MCSTFHPRHFFQPAIINFQNISFIPTPPPDYLVLKSILESILYKGFPTVTMIAKFDDVI